MRSYFLKIMALITGVFLIFIVPVYAQSERFTAVIGALDKITARTIQLELPQDRIVRFGTLKIVARACFTRPPTETPETYIYLQIDDVLADGTEERVFSGWMLASSPALNALEHAVYDVWAINCKTSSDEISSPNL